MIIINEFVGTWQVMFVTSFEELFSPVHIDTESNSPVKERLRYWGMCHGPPCNTVYTVQPGYNDIGLCDTSSITFITSDTESHSRRSE